MNAIIASDFANKQLIFPRIDYVGTCHHEIVSEILAVIFIYDGISELVANSIPAQIPFHHWSDITNRTKYIVRNNRIDMNNVKERDNIIKINIIEKDKNTILKS